jgi:hypothetical protein
VSHDLGDVLVTHAEWEALLYGARALRAIAGDLRDAGARDDAAELDRSAVSLDGLVQRATVAAQRSGERDKSRQAEAER